MEKITMSVNWSVDWEGKSVLELLAEKPKMSYADVMEVIHNEGGYINENAVICKGTAKNKIVTID